MITTAFWKELPTINKFLLTRVWVGLKSGWKKSGWKKKQLEESLIFSVMSIEWSTMGKTVKQIIATWTKVDWFCASCGLCIQGKRRCCLCGENYQLHEEDLPDDITFENATEVQRNHLGEIAAFLKGAFCFHPECVANVPFFPFSFFKSLFSLEQFFVMNVCHQDI